ncbi:AAA family ATPase [Planctomycetota bacterium]
MSQDDIQAVARLKDAYTRMDAEIGKVIVGQKGVVEEILTGIFSRGHCLIVGVPGLAKTLLVRTIAKVLALEFNRIQFTPDLMPSDITGTDILHEDRASGIREFRFLKGPVFANIVLADEINRTPPKTQAALLEAMQEHAVTASGNRYQLEPPFFVLATQNPIEQEGTYPLPEAQLDRFMFNVKIGYPTESEEKTIARVNTISGEPQVEQVLGVEEMLSLQELVVRVPVPDHVYDYAAALTRSTRPGEGATAEYVGEWVSWGAGPRATQYLVLGAKARAALHGRYHASVEDVQAVAPAVLRHRILTNFNAEAEGIDSDQIIAKLIADTPKVEG